jgi:hypothetical protein
MNAMKKLSPEEVSAFKVKGKRNASPLFETLINLKNGETLHVEPADWNRKRSPSKMCRYIEKRYTMKFECWTLTEKKGWLVKCIS